MKLRTIFLFLIVLINTTGIRAQGTIECATTIPSGVTLLQAQSNNFNLYKRTVITHPLRLAVHIVKNTNGSGGISQAGLDSMITDLNLSMVQALFEFYAYKTDFIYNDYFTNINNDSKANELRLVNAIENCINVYFVPQAYFSGTSSFSSRIQDPSVWAEQGIIIRNDASPTTLPHEMGHYFDLFHTFETYFNPRDEQTGQIIEWENIARTGSCANWVITGDLLADTPSDPSARVQFPTINLNCQWINPPVKPLPPDGCGQTNYNSLTNNMMITQVNQCRTTLTENQKDRMNETLILYRSELLKSLVYLENSANSVKAEGTLHIGGGNYFSGDNALVEDGTYNIGTNNERFTNFQGGGFIYKHNNWNDLSGDLFLSRNIEITVDNDQVGRFNKLNPTTIRNIIDGMSFNDGVPISFNDPWYVKDVNDNQSGMGDFISPPSPYSPIGKYDQTTGGVFLDQGGTGFTPPYYSVKVDAVFDAPMYSTGVPTGRNHKFYFQGWTGTEVQFENANALQTGIVFKDEILYVDPKVEANLKGTGLSDNIDAYTNNGQRKTIRTPDYDNTIHRVYESLGHVWYETSTDNGQTWVLMNDGHPLDNAGGKSPSIDYAVINNHVLVVIVYQEIYANSFAVKAAVYKSLWGDLPFQYLETEEIFYRFYFTDNANPVISINKMGTTIIVWEVTGSGLYYRNAGLHETGLNLAGSNNILTGTNSYSKNPSISAPKTPNSNVSHLVWEENNSIKHFTFYSSPPATITTISSGDGYTYNRNPSIITLSDGEGRICWIGSRSNMIDRKKENDSPTIETRTIFRGTGYNHFWAFGNTVSSPNITNSDDESYYAIAWSEGDGTTTKFTDNTLSTVRDFNIPGKDIQVSNGATKNQMYADIFRSATQPYYFNMSNNLGSYYTPQKATAYNFASGREGVIYQDTAQFYFTVGDIIVNDQSIDFIEIPDSIELNTKEMLNTYLVSEPFQLTDYSMFLYSIKYGASDSSAAVDLLSNTNNFINFKLQLIDAQSLEVLGSFDEVTFDQSNVFRYNNLSYQVNTAGIGNRSVFLRLKVEDNFNPDYSLSQIYSDNDILEKISLQTINYTGKELPVTYDLAQNFPNPFNPSTTIHYQIPQAGIVTLKIYDILGAEVATLVDEEKIAGKYEVNFNASSLASGVYIYKIQAGSFINSKKMILLK